MVQDALQAGDTNIDNLGRQIILPATFTSSPRQMKQLYLNAIAIVRAKGKPSLFITMTCNAKWPEIVEALLPGQAPGDRPDLVVRVFHLKLKALLKDVVNKHVFGRVTGYVYTIEFQKRELPHTHILLILNPLDRLGDPDIVDSVVSAEIPNREEYLELHATVTKCMVRGPCGQLNPRSPCMAENVCTKGFPKAFQDETVFADNAYPTYKR